MRKFPLVFISVLFFVFGGLSQSLENEVVILVNGSGSSIEIAKQRALRSALEQAYGAFFSSKTEIFNDKVIVDQMISVASGNIKSFKIINQDNLPDGRFSITIQAFLSIDKLSTFVKSKGVDVEFNGGIFALNVKQQILNEDAEMIAISEMVGVLHETMQNSVDFTVEAGSPISSDENNQKWKIPLVVSSIWNKNVDFCSNYFMRNLKLISLTPAEINSYKSIGKNVYQLTCKYNGVKSDFYLRRRDSFETINSYFSNFNKYLSNFIIYSTDVTNDKSSMVKDDIESVLSMSEIKNKEVKRVVDFVEPTISFCTKVSDSKLEIELQQSGKKGALIKLFHELTLSKLEKISGYSISSAGFADSYKRCGLGGVIVREPVEKFKLGLVVTKSKWSEEKKAQVIVNGPSYRSGIRSGDQILEMRYEDDYYNNFIENEIDRNWDTEVDNHVVIIKIKNSSGEREVKVVPELGIRAGLVMAFSDIQNVLSREDAIKKCEELRMNGFDDWRVPFGYSEIDDFRFYFVFQNFWNFSTDDSGYWTYYKPFRNKWLRYGYYEKELFTFRDKWFTDVDLEGRAANVRPVRSFYSNQ